MSEKLNEKHLNESSKALSQSTSSEAERILKRGEKNSAKIVEYLAASIVKSLKDKE